jgi:hypothetical protein
MIFSRFKNVIRSVIAQPDQFKRKELFKTILHVRWRTRSNIDTAQPMPCVFVYFEDGGTAALMPQPIILFRSEE